MKKRRKNLQKDGERGRRGRKRKVRQKIRK